jgi:glycosyltransferase involved in cell wall biosynthesis
VVDDGSEPTARAAVEEAVTEAALTNAYFMALPQHCGMAAARNYGLRALECEWTLLLDSDDQLASDACDAILSHVDHGQHLLYADHVLSNFDGTDAVTRRKVRYQEELQRWGATWASPFLHATFLFHPQVYRTQTLLANGAFNEAWGYGDEIEAQLAIEAEYGPTAIAHIPRVLYRYIRNPRSVVHQPTLYKRLIENIEQILLAGMRRFRGDVVACTRLGRSVEYHAAHYTFRAEAGHLELPWFDSATLQLTPADSSRATSLGMTGQ